MLRRDTKIFARGAKERFQAFATLTGILAGFSFASAIGLVAMAERGWASITAMSLLFGSAGLLLGSTLACYMLVASAANLEAYADDRGTEAGYLQHEVNSFRETVKGETGLLMMWFGFLLLLAGGGVAGWIVSPIVGVVSSVSCLIALLAAYMGFGK